MTLEVRRTCRCGHGRALHGLPRQAPCTACTCSRYAGGLVVVLSVRAQEPAARVVLPDEVPDAPAPYVRPTHSAGTGGVPRWDAVDQGAPAAGVPLAARVLVPPRSSLAVSRESEVV